MSLISMLKRKVKTELFTTPSHSQGLFIFSKFRQFYKYDISETDAYEPQAALDSAQKKASEIYGTQSTHFLTNGSTSGVIAAVLACVEKEEKVLIWDNAHPCHQNAARLAGATPVFYDVEKNEDWGIYTSVKPQQIEKYLKQDKIKAVIVTSPSYEGVVSDIKSISEICKKYGSYLIVDEAWGALYPFCDRLPESAIYQGADFVNQSLHKTAGGLNPTAVLHCSRHCETISISLDIQYPPKQSCSHDKFDVKLALDLIYTTSPSYPLLASIEKNVNYLSSQKGRKKIFELLKNIENLRKNVKNCEFYVGNDPTKILIKAAGMSGFELSEFLYQNGIEDERTNEKSTMLLCGLGTDLKKLKKLEQVLKKLNGLA